mmetsp:Transcript_30778/g.42879  ORF Transcript_30778/g.42879 Transcript_30778/m.42879 type:complete len:227 (-) Transcript_30778:504-1184(-)
MGVCCSSEERPNDKGTTPEPQVPPQGDGIKVKEGAAVDGAEKKQPPKLILETDREKKAARESLPDEDAEAFNKLKSSIIQGWTHIIGLITDKMFQDFAEEIGLKSYFEITPHKPMENFFRKCLDFEDPDFEVQGVDLDKEASIDFERKKFQIFLTYVAKTDFKKSYTVNFIENELNRAVRTTVDSFEKYIKVAEEHKVSKIKDDLEIFAQIFKYLLDDDGEEDNDE